MCDKQEKKQYSMTIWIVGSIILTLGCLTGVICTINNMYIRDNKVRYPSTLNIFLFLFSIMIVIMFLLFVANMCVYFFKDCKIACKKGDILPAFISKKSLNGIPAAIFSYLIIIVLFTIVNVGFDYFNEFIDKTNEFEYYCQAYIKNEKSIETRQNEIHAYANQEFLEGRKYHFFKTNTMYNLCDNAYTKEFLTVYESAKRGQLDDISIKSIISIENPEMILNNIVEHFYYSVQVISTLGFGNITPGNTIGMGIAILGVILAQIYTIILVGQIIGISIGRKINN